MSMPSRTLGRFLLGAFLLLSVAPALQAQRVTTPMAQFGHNIGDDYWLATYTELTEYWQKLATESSQMVFDTIGYTAEGRPHLMAIITSPANHANLEQHKRNARRLALATDLNDDESRGPRSPWCGSTGDCTRPRSLVRLNSWRWLIRW
jgi:hypothetical protein